MDNVKYHSTEKFISFLCLYSFEALIDSSFAIVMVTRREKNQLIMFLSFEKSKMNLILTPPQRLRKK